jgi:hypothetical protein
MAGINGDDFSSKSLWASTVRLAFALITRHIVNKLRRI